MKKDQPLVDQKCLDALATIGLDGMARGLATEAEKLSASQAETTLGFTDDDDTIDAKYIAKLKVVVERVS